MMMLLLMLLMIMMLLLFCCCHFFLFFFRSETACAKAIELIDEVLAAEGFPAVQVKTRTTAEEANGAGIPAQGPGDVDAADQPPAEAEEPVVRVSDNSLWVGQNAINIHPVNEFFALILFILFAELAWSFTRSVAAHAGKSHEQILAEAIAKEGARCDGVGG